MKLIKVRNVCFDGVNVCFQQFYVCFDYKNVCFGGLYVNINQIKNWQMKFWPNNPKNALISNIKNPPLT